MGLNERGRGENGLKNDVFDSSAVVRLGHKAPIGLRG